MYEIVYLEDSPHSDLNILISLNDFTFDTDLELCME